MRIFITSIIALCFLTMSASNDNSTTLEQPTKVALKTNIAADVLLNVNFGAEVSVLPHYTIDVTHQINTWTMSRHRKWKHWFLEPELRRWLGSCFNGHFVALTTVVGIYNLGSLKNDIMILGTDFSKIGEHRYEGWMVGAGIAYGYCWHFDKHWSLEGELGFGYAASRYRVFNLDGAGLKIRDKQFHNYVGPNKIALNIVYNF